jgi:hypothetical protein
MYVCMYVHIKCLENNVLKYEWSVTNLSLMGIEPTPFRSH